MDAYAGLQDVDRLALTLRAFVVVPRPLDPRQGDALDYATGTFSLTGHAYGVDDVVRFVTAGASVVPGGATAGVPLYPIPLDFWRFRLAASQNGTALTFTNAGTWYPPEPSGWALQIDPTARLLAQLAQASADVNQDLTAHAPPITRDPSTGRFPQVLVGIVARIAARATVTSLQIENAAYRVAVDRLFAQEARDDAQRAAWRLGQPLNPKAQDQDTLADIGAIAANDGTATPGGATLWRTGTL